MAVFIWGRPRFTADIDILIKLNAKDIDALAVALGALHEMSYIDMHMMRNAFQWKGEFNFIDGESGIKVDFFIAEDTHFEQLQIKRHIRKPVLGYNVHVISPEDLILSKLLWYKQGESSKQLEDIESVIKIQKKIDWKYINKWAKIHTTAKTLASLRKKYV